MNNNAVNDYICIKNSNFNAWRNSIANYIAYSASEYNDTIFQTNFGFAGADCPETIYVSIEHTTGSSIAITIKCYSNDYPLFKIDNDSCDGITDTYVFNNSDDDSDSIKNPVELFNKYVSDRSLDYNITFELPYGATASDVVNIICCHISSYLLYMWDEEDWADFDKSSYVAIIYAR